MAISDKTRKILWGRSGNRCTICKHELVIDATPEDDESVVGDECHIVSSRANGPRYDASFPSEKIDSYENITLLCRIHHKMVDDQADTFTADILRQMKTNHEAWVSERLTDDQKIKPLKLKRQKHNIPEYLSRITTGKQLLDILIGAFAYEMNHDELKSQDEVDLIGGFLQTARDWGELGDDMESSDRVSAAYNLSRSIEELEQAGFFVFGGREVQLLEGGVQATPSNWPIAILHVLHKDNDSIISINLNDMKGSSK